MNLDSEKQIQPEELTPIEKEIIEQYIMKVAPENYADILEKDTRTEVALALSPIRKNILCWYPIPKNATILEMDANLGEVTGLLCEKGKKVIAIEENISKANAIRKRYENKDNIEIKTENAEASEEKFDYVVIYQPEKIKLVKNLVKPNGTILLATNNRFGIAYFAGASFQGKLYHTILDAEGPLYGKKEIEKLLQEQGLKQYQFYYPLPNYKMPNVIFSEQYMPNENTTKMMYNIMYEKGSVVVFDELKALKQLTKNGLFDFFANSYLVEIKMPENNQTNPIHFISFNNNRKEEYQLATILEENKIKKQMISPKAQKHMKSIELNTKNLKKLGFHMIDEIVNDEVISQYIEGDTFDKKIVTLLLQGNIEEAYGWIEKWYDHLKQRLLKNKRSGFNENIQATPEELEGLTILKNGYIDLVFENTFYQNDEFLFFDQEWYADGIPIEFLLYRAIQNMYAYNLEIENKYPKQKVLEKFGLTTYTELFQRIEQYIQKDIIDDKMIEVNKQSLARLHDINYTSILLNQIQDFEENDKKQNQYIYDLETDNKNKQKYIESLEEDNRNKQKYIEELEEQIQEKKEKRKFF